MCVLSALIGPGQAIAIGHLVPSIVTLIRSYEGRKQWLSTLIPTWNSAFSPLNSYTQSEAHVNWRLASLLLNWLPPDTTDKLVKKLLRFLDTKRKTLCEGNTLRARIWLLTYLLTRCYVTLRKHLYNYHRYPEFGSVLVDSAMIFERESLLGLIDFYVFSAFGGLFLGPRSRGHKFTLNFKSDPWFITLVIPLLVAVETNEICAGITRRIWNLAVAIALILQRGSRFIDNTMLWYTLLCQANFAAFGVWFFSLREKLSSRNW